MKNLSIWLGDGRKLVNNCCPEKYPALSLVRVPGFRKIGARIPDEIKIDYINSHLAEMPAIIGPDPDLNYRIVLDHLDDPDGRDYNADYIYIVGERWGIEYYSVCIYAACYHGDFYTGPVNRKEK